MIVKPEYRPKPKIYYVPNRYESIEKNVETFNSDVKALDKFIRYRLKNKHIDKITDEEVIDTNFIRIGYDLSTNSDLIHTNIRKQLNQPTAGRQLLWENNYWYVYKYDGADTLMQVLKIRPEFSFQIITKPKHIEIKKIYTTVITHSRYTDLDEYGMYKYPTRLFKYRQFNIVPITDKEYKKYTDIKQPFYKLNNKTISVRTVK